MKRILFPAAALATAFACAPAAAQTVLTLSTWVPPTHALSMAQVEWCELVAKNANGKIRCNVLPRAVAAPPGTLDAVRNGLADVSFTVHGYTPGRFVVTQLAEFPFLGDSAEVMSVAFNKVASRHPAFADEHKGIKVLAYFTHGPGIVFNTKRPVTRMEDLQGLKWRVGGGMVNEIAKTLDMNVTLKPAPESYELLTGGVMDGTLFPAESIESFRIDKVIKHATTFPGGLYNTSFVFMMNQDKYNKLSADEKKAVDAASGEVAARIIGRHWDKVDRRAFGLMQANNVQVVKADAKFVADIKKRTSALEEKWAKDAQAKGLKDPAKVLAEFRSEIEKASK
ncbi:TRAP transporter substrate-binding protein [Ramlibacter henchirensis]|jgi:TRAP-type transport system periplasmic protein|uniref:TRAP transporter substrate-binding protein n=1 Tax=Ramlibacter henchirensis TaxID=204072 RepID=A0A4Z0BTZ4_9BURK|nr:TRAP transporter substrate-binding protein [Ramlibacter henchirensis]TFZ02311.1 TRAP transporter substrate-binding protein [Ramlibacter henchirensis]